MNQTKETTGPTVLVTGGCGFVGSNLVARLAAEHPGADLFVIDDFRSSSFANLVEACDRAGVGPFTGTVHGWSTNEIDWEEVIEAISPDAVFHLAAITDTTVMDERIMLEGNVEGFRDLMIATAGREIPLVYASSAATYGTPPQTGARVPFPVDAAGRPNNIYGFSKWLMECEHRRFAREWEQQSGTTPHIVGLRYFNVFGPGEARKGKMASIAYQLAQQMLAGKRPRLFADGSQARDQVHVDDVVSCTIAGSMHGVRPGVYNLGSGQVTSFADVAAAVREGMGLSESEFPVDYFEMPEHIRAFYQDFTQADMTLTQDGLSWSPGVDPIEGLRSYGRWLADSADQPAVASA
ncbi:MAG: NAD-dependent epimerase/dehydratase family protein [bacterium]|nr:NAD-dependent epimerase/dehydratase family protein [bacterium]